MINKQKILKNFLIILASILLTWFLWIMGRDWLKPNIIKALGGYTNMEMKHTTDTLSVKYNDIYTKYKQISTQADITVEPEYITVYKDRPKATTKGTSTTGEVQPKIAVLLGVKRYQTSVNDTILQGNIETIISLDSCKIVSQTLNYQPKIPYIREKIVTIVETKETTLSQKPKVHIGVGLDVNNINQITPHALFLSKKKWLYKVGYTKSLDNIYPDAYTIGIAKLF